MWPDVKVDDLEARWRPLTDAEKTVAEERLEDAASDLQLALEERGLFTPPTSDAWERRFIRTAVEMVRRYLINPDGWLEETERIDDWSETKRRDAAVSTGAVYFTDAELVALIPRDNRRRGAFSIRLGAT